MQHKQRGFTLVEILIAIAIFALLFLVGVPLTMNYLQQRQFESTINDLRQQMVNAYSNSVQGVTGVDKGNLVDSDSDPDRVSWFVLFDKTTSPVKYSIGACTPAVTPESASVSCLAGTDRDYKQFTLPAGYSIDLVPATPPALGNKAFLSFDLITGHLTVWKTSAPTPIDLAYVEVVVTEGTRSATLRVNQYGGISVD